MLFANMKRELCASPKPTIAALSVVGYIKQTLNPIGPATFMHSLQLMLVLYFPITG